MAIKLITGGSRSGKSRHALQLAMKHNHRAFIATATAFDDEMKDRITKHQEERGDAFNTIEAPTDLAAALAAIPAGTEVVLIDCLTVWLGNLMHEGDLELSPHVDAFLSSLEEPPCELLIVSNEVGMGIVPEHAMARQFRDMAGILNQQVATLADQVIFCVSGIPTIIKPSNHQSSE